MRLSYTSNHIADTVLVDDSGRHLYSTTSSTFGGKTEVKKVEPMWSSNLATFHFTCLLSDTVAMKGDSERPAKSYIAKPSWYSRRRVFTSANGNTYEWIARGLSGWILSLPDGTEVGRSHSRSFGLLGTKHTPYLEFNDDPAILSDLDELVATFVYVQIRREKDERASGSAPVATG